MTRQAHTKPLVSNSAGLVVEVATAPLSRNADNEFLIAADERTLSCSDPPPRVGTNDVQAGRHRALRAHDGSRRGWCGRPVFFRDHFCERLMANVGIVLVFGAFYFRFLKHS